MAVCVTISQLFSTGCVCQPLADGLWAHDFTVDAAQIPEAQLPEGREITELLIHTRALQEYQCMQTQPVTGARAHLAVFLRPCTRGNIGAKIRKTCYKLASLHSTSACHLQLRPIQGNTNGHIYYQHHRSRQSNSWKSRPSAPPQHT